MRFMIINKASKESEAGVMPTEEMFAEMGKYMEEMANAGILRAAEGLQSSAKGARVRFSGGTTTVVDGPFAETKELIAGFTLIEVGSKQEALEWVKRFPCVGADDFELELRQVFDAEDFDEEFTPELREQEEKLRAEIAQKQ